ncbi:MAG: glycosyltransferase [Candidatus Delongbacteria bacterium]|nr:glycosyltransferase [Candidatus Delongbacteria bacterium]
MKYSIVIPVYNSQDILSDLLSRLEAVMKVMAAQDQYQIILVNDFSRDATWERVLKIVATRPNIIALNLGKNYGEDNARMAGFNQAEGDIIITMDDDLQHNPSDIPALIAHMESQRADICFGRFPVKNQAVWKNLGSRFNDLMARILLKKPPSLYLSTFIVFKKWVRDEIIKYSGPFPYVQGLLLSVSSRITQLDVTHHPRLRGRGNYSLIKSLRLWLKVATGFSIFPLRLASYLGFITASFSLIYGLYILVEYLFFHRDIKGWASLFTIIIFFGSIQLILFGIIGEFLGRIYLNINRKPQYTLSDCLYSRNLEHHPPFMREHP